MKDIDRFHALKTWVSDLHGARNFTIEPASADASFRRYFRVDLGNTTYIAMDAPPEHEDCESFVNIDRLIESHGLHVPHIFNADLGQGFILLSDLGSAAYLDKLNTDTVDRLYGDALNALFTMQTEVPCDGLPPYDDTLLNREMALFRDWFLQTHLGLELDAGAEAILNDTFGYLTENALAQPKVFVHRDYHSRNLMVTGHNNPGILDFQDAVSGPVTYDLVSLLRDCYVAWPDSRIYAWAAAYHRRLVQYGFLDGDYDRFQQWFDGMGMQRHLKAIGIFSRLNHRDGKSGYLKDIPRTLGYVLNVSSHYPALESFAGLMRRLRVAEYKPA
jgi:aminoglycoside/choline kinase family phosphotransferase